MPRLSSENDIFNTIWTRIVNIDKKGKLYIGISIFQGILLSLLGVYGLFESPSQNRYCYLAFFMSLCIEYFTINGILTESHVNILSTILSSILVTSYLMWFTVKFIKKK